LQALPVERAQPAGLPTYQMNDLGQDDDLGPAPAQFDEDGQEEVAPPTPPPTTDRAAIPAAIAAATAGRELAVGLADANPNDPAAAAAAAAAAYLAARVPVATGTRRSSRGWCSCSQIRARTSTRSCTRLCATS